MRLIVSMIAWYNQEGVGAYSLVLLQKAARSMALGLSTSDFPQTLGSHRG